MKTVRKIITIDEEKCDGCGICANACVEGAIAIIDGKARLVSETYCDGLGACIGHCPQDAITIEQRETVEFDEEAAKEHLARMKKVSGPAGFVCPGMMMKNLKPNQQSTPAGGPVPSQLKHWPVQLHLVSPYAPYFANADMLLVADCVPFAMGDFHNKFLKDHSIAIACPKLDDSQLYIEKFAEIIKSNTLNSLTVIHMEVPCCFGLTHIARQAIAASGKNLPFTDVTIDLKGNVRKTELTEAGT